MDVGGRIRVPLSPPALRARDRGAQRISAEPHWRYRPGRKEFEFRADFKMGELRARDHGAQRVKVSWETRGRGGAPRLHIVAPGVKDASFLAFGVPNVATRPFGLRYDPP